MPSHNGRGAGNRVATSTRGDCRCRARWPAQVPPAPTTVRGTKSPVLGCCFSFDVLAGAACCLHVAPHIPLSECSSRVSSWGGTMGWVPKRTCPGTPQEALIAAAASGERAPTPNTSTDMSGTDCAAHKKDSFSCESLPGCMWGPCGCTALGDWTCSSGKKDVSQHPKPLTQWE